MTFKISNKFNQTKIISIILYLILFLTISGIISKYLMNNYVGPKIENIEKSLSNLNSEKNIIMMKITCETKISEIYCIKFFKNYYGLESIKNSKNTVLLFFEQTKDLDHLVKINLLDKKEDFIKLEKLIINYDINFIIFLLNKIGIKNELISTDQIAEKILNENFKISSNINYFSYKELSNDSNYNSFFNKSQISKKIINKREELLNNKLLSINFLNIFLTIFFILLLSLFSIKFIYDLIKIIIISYKK